MREGGREGGAPCAQEKRRTYPFHTPSFVLVLGFGFVSCSRVVVAPRHTLVLEHALYTRSRTCRLLRFAVRCLVVSFCCAVLVVVVLLISIVWFLLVTTRPSLPASSMKWSSQTSATLTASSTSRGNEKSILDFDSNTSTSLSLT